MAIAPRRALTGAQERDDVQGQEDDPFLDEGADGEGGQGSDGAGEAEDDAALDPDAEQETGGEEDLEFDALPLSRTATRLQRLAHENAELKRQNADINRRLTPPPQPTFQGPREETDQEFNARLQLLPPDERMEQRQIRFEARAEARQRWTAFQTQEQTDKTNFDAKAAADQRYARWAERVEAKRNEFMQQGQLVPREVVLKYLIGEHMLSPKGQKEAGRRTARAQERVRRTETRPGAAGSDVAPGRRATDDRTARARRLENQQI